MTARAAKTTSRKVPQLGIEDPSNGDDDNDNAEIRGNPEHAARPLSKSSFLELCPLN
jgi:hypothetical protein